MTLPGRKILLRGNHDMFWDAKKTEKLNEMFKGKLERLRCSFEVAKAAGYEKIYYVSALSAYQYRRDGRTLKSSGVFKRKIKSAVHRMSFNRFLYNKTV